MDVVYFDWFSFHGCSYFQLEGSKSTLDNIENISIYFLACTYKTKYKYVCIIANYI